MKTDYNKLFNETVARLSGKPKLLLHVCCAPCLSGVIGRLENRFDITLFYYNPNIFPDGEYAKRLDGIKKYFAASGRNFAIIGGGDSEGEYAAATSQFEKIEGSERCNACCRLRIMKTAEKAAIGRFDYFCTTLTVSPHKNAEKINESMQSAEKLFGIKYLPCDFKKEGGFAVSTAECEKYGIYRQSYCGCNPRVFKVFVTGAMASGKSLFVRMLGDLGAYTISADEISRRLTAEGGKLNDEIKTRFPEAVNGGELDRAKLKQIVFSDDCKRKMLNSLTHRAIFDEINRTLARVTARVAAVEVPLLFESGIEFSADVVVAISSDEKDRAARAKMRDGIDADMFNRISSSQFSDDERNNRSDIVIKNDGNVNKLKGIAEELYRSWLKKE